MYVFLFFSLEPHVFLRFIFNSALGMDAQEREGVREGEFAET